MLPDRVSNPGPLTCKSGALPIALGGPAFPSVKSGNLQMVVLRISVCCDILSHSQQGSVESSLTHHQ